MLLLACSVFEATGLCNVVAFNAGNLKPVAETIRDKFPNKAIIILADNDQWREGNPGITKATAAAKTIGAYIAISQFNDTSSKPTDFNDLHCMEGLEVVKLQIESVLNTAPKEVVETPEEVIQRLSKLPPIEYESVRKEEAKKLGFRPNELDKYVKKPDHRMKKKKLGVVKLFLMIVKCLTVKSLVLRF